MMVTLLGMDEVAGAIADPVRREILLMLRAAPLSAGQIADRFAISRPAVSRHLRVLREAGLVTVRVDAQRRCYQLRLDPLRELDDWLAPYRELWSNRLDALEQHLDRMAGEGQSGMDHYHPGGDA
jgi:DNA-binding transcriptional ArsR family regulator